MLPLAFFVTKKKKKKKKKKKIILIFLNNIYINQFINHLLNITFSAPGASTSLVILINLLTIAVA